MPITLDIVNPARLVFSRAVDMAVMPGYEGDLAAMENHAPMITLLRGGVITLTEAGVVTEKFFVGGGFAEITPTRCTILADDCVPVSAVSTASAQSGLAAAEAAWVSVDKMDINARDAVLDRLQSARAAVWVAS